SLPGVRFDAGNEEPVDLDEIRLGVVQKLEARVPCPEVVDRNPVGLLSVGIERRVGAEGVAVQVVLFRKLEHHRVRGNPESLEYPGSAAGGIVRHPKNPVVDIEEQLELLMERDPG